MSENPCPVWTSAFICERAQKTSVYVSMQMQAYGTCEYVEEKGQSLSVSFLWWPRSINCFLSTETITPKLYCRSSTSCWIANNHIFYFPKKPTSQWQVHDQSKTLKTNKTERLWVSRHACGTWTHHVKSISLSNPCRIGKFLVTRTSTFILYVVCVK